MLISSVLRVFNAIQYNPLENEGGWRGKEHYCQGLQFINEYLKAP